MATLLWIIAVILVIAGIYVLLARRDILWGIVLIVLGLLVGPGGVSIFHV
ncbi:GPGG-motif small membrane protein [Nonomuraea fastidiosa]